MGLSTSAKVGIVTITALTLLAMVIVWKTEIFKMREGYIMTGSFNSIEGLTVGSEVRFRGLKIGKVMKIDPGPYDIKIFSVIEPRIKIPVDSSLRVAYDGIVGLKYLEIKPGTAETMYEPSMVINGVRTAAIVDFIDIGSQNLQESKLILADLRRMIENPQLQNSVLNMVVMADEITQNLNRLTEELRETNRGIKDIVGDPKFQENVKGTIRETEKTLSSANQFFDNFGKINMRSSGGVDIGSRANAVRGDVDILQGDKIYYRLGIGEGPTRQMSLLDVLFTSAMSDDVSFRLGMINSQLGGGFVFKPGEKNNVIADLYDINNPRPNMPKFRLGYERELVDYLDLLFQADDLLNGNNSNFMLGIRVKPQGGKLF
ncbi:MAG: MCE family protein [Candidatus Margulisbacteria bacterium]|nr:MCE family protein [Candidatus Margulisiibacteriota bacterium]MBU1616828.1 MCE family protein [Candidatus Margulisiibacteriota bacterium]